MTNNNHRLYLPHTRIELINPDLIRRGFCHAVFDFDGTVSLIRQGWQQMMAKMMVEALLATPQAEDEATLQRLMTDYVAGSTGQATIFQMEYLVEEVRRRGGRPKSAPEYKQMYIDRLNEQVERRLRAVDSNPGSLAELMVPGAAAMLGALRQQHVTCYLASGTDEQYVINEARILGVADYFNGGMYGARDDGRMVTKKMLLDRILSENHLAGHQLVVFGDGTEEIARAAEAGCIAVGVASDEVNRQGINEAKRQKLLEVGADLIVPDFGEGDTLLRYLTGNPSLM
ncbi:MAG: HAD family hydrolase [Chloroflexota bacterium]